MGPVDELRPLWQAMAFMPAGLLFDFMDGKVARWRRKSSLMGQELDSLADLVSFGVAPATCVYAWGLRTLVDTLVLVFFVLCGLSRLARFNVSVNSVPKDASGKAKYFEGTPIPTTLGLVLVVAVSTYCGFGGGNALPGGVWASGTLVEVHPFVFLFMLSGFCMTSKSLKIPKYVCIRVLLFFVLLTSCFTDLRKVDPLRCVLILCTNSNMRFAYMWMAPKNMFI